MQKLLINQQKKTYFYLILSIIFIFSSLFLGLFTIQRDNNLPADINTVQADANFAGGDGSQSSPFEIANKQQLYNLAMLVNNLATNPTYYNKYYKLTADIVFNGTEQWTPIGKSDSINFGGHFDGNNFTIKNLTITSAISGFNYYGLFGYVCGTSSNLAEIKDLGLVGTNINVESDAYVGGIVGYAYNLDIFNCYNVGNILATYDLDSPASAGGIAGTVSNSNISNCYNIGDITVNGNSTARAGGIAGEAYSTTISNCYNIGDITVNGNGNSSAPAGGIAGYASSTTIENCYNIGDITVNDNSSDYVGGIAGLASSTTITNCYNVGFIFASGSSSYKGGIIGYSNSNNQINYCYALTGKGYTAMYGGGVTAPTETSSEIKTLVEMTTQSTYSGWDFTNVWVIASEGLPYLRAIPLFSGGNGTSGNPYQISTKEQLYTFADLINNPNTNPIYYDKYYILTADITFASDGSEQWIPIGKNSSSNYYFGGYFDGNNKTITNLTITSPIDGFNYYGLFGYVKGTDSSNRAEIKNLGLVGTNINVESDAYAGGIAGYADYYTDISNCYNIGDITVNVNDNFISAAGGIAGLAYSTTITNCYNIGDITANGNSFSAAGGIAGLASSITISNCYNIGYVTSSSFVIGGIIGRSNSSNLQINNCYALENRGYTAVYGGGTAPTVTSSEIKTLAEMTTQSKYSGWDFTNVWGMAGLPYLRGITRAEDIYYSLTYDYNYDGENDVIEVHNAGTVITLPNLTGTRAGYTFNGWKDGSTTYTSTYTMPASNVTLTAIWTLQSYTITYELDNGTNDLGNPDSYTIENPTITLQPATKLGYYTFDGWYESSDFSGSPVTQIDTSRAEDITLYAKFVVNTYTVTFDANGGSGTMNPQTFTYGVAQNLTANAFTRTGYTFQGWSTTSTGNVEYLDQENYNIGAGNVTLYAVWTANIYTVTFNANGGSGTMNPQTFTYGVTQNLIANAFTRTGYTFAGWATTADGEIEYDDKASYTIGAGNVTFYAKWTANEYTVTFNANGGSGTMNPQIFTYGIEQNLTANLFTRIGYTFQGWATTADGEVEYGDEASYTIGAGNVTLYAVWTANNLVFNGGTLPNATYKTAYGPTSAFAAATNGTGTYTYAIVSGAPTGIVLNSDRTFSGTPTSNIGTYNIVVKVTDNGSGVTAQATFVLEVVAKEMTYSIVGYTGTYNGQPHYATITMTEPTSANVGYSGINGVYTTYFLTALNTATNFADMGRTNTGTTTIYYQITADNYVTVTGSVTITIDKQTLETPTNLAWDTSVQGSAIATWNAVTNANGYTITLYNSSNAVITTVTSTVTSYDFGYIFTASACTGYYFKVTATQSDVENYNNSSASANSSALSSYAFSFNTNNGTAVPSQYIIHGQKATTETTTRTGYTFNGWYKEAGLTTVWNFATDTVTSTTTVYAKWGPDKYTITYNLNGGTNHVSNPSTYSVDIATITLQPATRIGYTFDGWYDNPQFIGNPITEIPTGSTGNKTFYAKWTAIEYTITYILNGGTNNVSNPATYTIETPTLTLQPATKLGYTFDGWFDNEDLIGDAITKIDNGSIGDRTFYAKWSINTYSISYELNGGTNDELNPVTYTVEDTITLQPATRIGYTFDGWYDNPQFIGNPITQISAGSTGNKTFYAKWTAIEYTITYILNGGTNNVSNPATYTIETSTITLQPATKLGYTFDGWFDNEDLIGDAITKIDNGSIGDRTFYAKWSINTYSISYELNGGTNDELNPVTYTVEDTITLQPATKTGYTFGGWYDNAEFDGNAITQIASGSTGNRTFYAKWTAIEYTITYILNGGTNNVSNPATYTIETPTLTLQPATKLGYTFEGWYDNADFSGNPVAQIPNGSTGDKILYAYFAIAEYNINYELNDGTNELGNPDTYTIETPTITLLPATKIGYTFNGWYRNSEFIGDIVREITIGSTGHITLYAKFDIIKFYIDFYDYDGSELGIPLQVIDYGNLVQVPSDPPIKGNCVFDGWYLDMEFSNEYEFDTPVTEEFTLYAKFLIEATLIVDISTQSEILILGNILNKLSTVQSTKVGYSIKNWIYEDEILTEETELDFSQSITFEAVLEPNTYLITFDLNYEDNEEEIDPKEVVYDSEIGELPIPTRKGCNFLGWYYEDTLIQSTDIFQIPENITLRAEWEIIPVNLTFVYIIAGVVVLFVTSGIIIVFKRIVKTRKYRKLKEQNEPFLKNKNLPK